MLCRGPARARVANGCLLAHGVLLELHQQLKEHQHPPGELGRPKAPHSKHGSQQQNSHLQAALAAATLHAAADCLKQVLKLGGAGALPLTCGEALLPLQGCITLLGPRLRPAAVEAIVGLCCQAMQKMRGEWQVRRAAADTLATLPGALGQQLPASPKRRPPAAGPAAEGDRGQSGREALAELAPTVVEAVQRHLKYDRVPQVRQAALALLQVRGPLWEGSGGLGALAGRLRA